AGSTVIICGRNSGKLEKAEKAIPGITAIRCDVGIAEQREKLAAEVLSRFPDLDILINNAGVQRYIDLKKGIKEVRSGENEVEINFTAPVELTSLLISHFLTRPSAAVINVSSGLGFMPMPIYNATKAALHTYSLVLRQQLKGTSVKVVEIVPPMVDTDLNKEGRNRAKMKYRGISIAEYIPSVIEGLENDSEIIFHGDAQDILTQPRGESEKKLLEPQW
ncbi:MAG: SDR family NAD(P)-dependent oxidoreductase, partial [Spirochaetes bacterium]|nr:SDR family NAD(P)-dependent oxidoreductase [Spirochaetota bacterium]